MIFYPLMMIGLLGWSLTTQAFTTTTSTHAKQQIERIAEQIQVTRKELNQNKTLRETHYHQLAETEKKISENIRQQLDIRQQSQQTQQTIQRNTSEQQHLRKQLTQMQRSLTQLVRIRYQLSPANPWQWLLKQDSAKKVTRHLAYHHFLLKANLARLQSIQKIQTELARTTSVLQKAQADRNYLQKQLITRENNLQVLKARQALLLSETNKQIENKQQLLAEYRQDQARLNRLFNHLSTTMGQTIHHLKSPQLNPAFVNPLTNPATHSEPLKQGLIFYAPEGEPVKAVLSGKVIFSDWLNGYGLLLIIDHGHGLMSLYAHNQSLFKSLGADVQGGESIASVGHTGGLAKNGLYFELRRHGKSIPPGEWIA